MPQEAISGRTWTVSHKVRADAKQVEIIVCVGEKLEIGIVSIPIGKATSTAIETIERKISEAFLISAYYNDN